MESVGWALWICFGSVVAVVAVMVVIGVAAAAVDIGRTRRSR